MALTILPTKIVKKMSQIPSANDPIKPKNIKSKSILSANLKMDNIGGKLSGIFKLFILTIIFEVS